MINTTLDNDFRKTFTKLLAREYKPKPSHITLKATWIETVLGLMIAISDEEFLYLLEFSTRKRLEREIVHLRKAGFDIIFDKAQPHTLIENELTDYFAGKLRVFKTPYRVLGSLFQQKVWAALCQIPYGETISYAEQAAAIGQANAYRAVANANGANQLAIIIPCHRVIASNGTSGGYGGGLAIKQWLLEHEKHHKKVS